MLTGATTTWRLFHRDGLNHQIDYFSRHLPQSPNHIPKHGIHSDCVQRCTVYRTGVNSDFNWWSRPGINLGANFTYQIALLAVAA